MNNETFESHILFTFKVGRIQPSRDMALASTNDDP